MEGEGQNTTGMPMEVGNRLTCLSVFKMNLLPWEEEDPPTGVLEGGPEVVGIRHNVEEEQLLQLLTRTTPIPPLNLTTMFRHLRE